ncbi:MAG: NADH dehydrogenase (quinone) subunit G [Nitrospiraceae bacterium]|nr:NADH dehydrogenase (quinone) subunit G [Nitrospiraceae bacterium]|tara:strand:- start:1950 stop:4613 length:2664 start_codon:yes stop_codon:yes gene_type:complete
MEHVKLTIDNREVEVEQGTLVIEAARELGIDIPHFCYHPKLGYDANCRMCHVEIEKSPKLQASCSVPVTDGMVVHTDTARVNESHKSVLEFILANHPLDCPVCDQGGRCDLQDYSHRYTPTVSRFEDVKRVFDKEYFGPVIEKQMNRCVSCMRCVRYCDNVIDAKALASTGRGSSSEIKHFGSHQLDCEFCGGCVQICPVGAFTNRVSMFDYRPWMLKRTDTTCGYCGDGCQLTFQTRDQQSAANTIIEVQSFHGTGRNNGDLCARGYFGFGFANHEARLTHPLIKRDGTHVQVTWEEALEYAAERLVAIKEQHGSDAVAGLASARLTNEDLYVFQKFMRMSIGTNQVDSSVRYGHINAAMAMGIVQGTTRWTVTYEDIVKAHTILLLGTKITDTNPIVGLKVKEAVKKGGAQLITVESTVPVIQTISNITNLASLHLQADPIAYGAVVQGLVNTVLDDGLVNAEIQIRYPQYIERLKQATTALSLRDCAQVSGVSAAQIKVAAKVFAESPKCIVLMGQGVLRSPGAFETTLNVFDLLLLTGKLDQEGSGLAVLTEENNEQGALEMGVVPEYLPGPSDRMSDTAKQVIQTQWGVEPATGLGLRLPEIIEAARDGSVKAMYIVGENPIESLPPSVKVRDALNHLDLLICHELFMTETAKCADIIFPACSYAEKDGTFTNSEGVVQKVCRALDPIGESHPDWEILVQVSNFMNVSMEYGSVKDVQDEISRVQSSARKTAKLDRKVLDRYIECETSNPRVDSRYVVEKPKPRDGRPLILTVGQSLFHSGKMSTFASGLKAIQTVGALMMHPDDGEKYGVMDGSLVKMESEHGEAVIPVKFNERYPQGTVFFPEHFSGAIGAVLSMTIDSTTNAPYFGSAYVSIAPSVSGA